jgi:hypothetical protein
LGRWYQEFLVSSSIQRVQRNNHASIELTNRKAKHINYYNPWFLLGSTLVCTANGLYTTFTSSSPDSHWIGFQILQGLGTGFAGQMGLLTVQNELKTRPAVIPVGIATVLFGQYFGTSVIQTIAGTIFHNSLVDKLESKAGLNETGVTILLEAGTLNVRERARDLWPERVGDVLGAYNEAITTVFVSCCPSGAWNTFFMVIC